MKNMLSEKIIFIIFVNFFIDNIYTSDKYTSNRLDCQQIQTVGYNKLLGYWHFIGEVNTAIPLVRCGGIKVVETSNTTFDATWAVVKYTEKILNYRLKAATYNSSSVQLSGFQSFIANIEVCVNNTLFFIERKKTGQIFLFSRNMTVASDISETFEPNETVNDLALYEYININCFGSNDLLISNADGHNKTNIEKLKII